jgi:hypothetical protein
MCWLSTRTATAHSTVWLCVLWRPTTLSHGGPLTKSGLWRFINGVVPETDRAFSEGMNDWSDRQMRLETYRSDAMKSTPPTEGRDSLLLPV